MGKCIARETWYKLMKADLNLNDVSYINFVSMLLVECMVPCVGASIRDGLTCQRDEFIKERKEQQTNNKTCA